LPLAVPLLTAFACATLGLSSLVQDATEARCNGIYRHGIVAFLTLVSLLVGIITDYRLVACCFVNPTKRQV